MNKDIEQKICQLDGGAFQALGDSYLAREKPEWSLFSLGSETGTYKTTKGTPDTYLRLNDKYIFVEYTTQKNQLFEKIKADLKKCLDVSIHKISLNQIEAIFYLHTSSNLTPSQCEDLQNLCSPHNISLKIIGINQLAVDLYLKYPVIARDYLGINLDSYQILSYRDFIKDYESNKFVAPLNTKFLFRKRELNLIEQSFQKYNIVVLKGDAGVGKTRLALQFARDYANKNKLTLLCISNKELPIYDDLFKYIEIDKKYIILIDDANQLKYINQIFSFIKNRSTLSNIKILITIRSYAVNQIIDQISNFDYFLVTIKCFSDNEIRILLKNELNIVNQSHQEKIVKIVRGNARLAMMAGKIAYGKKSLDFICDTTQLYYSYYGPFLNTYFDNDYYRTVGIIAFFSPINLEEITSNTLSNLIKIDINKFNDNVKKLYELEIIDIYEEQLVNLSDQCLSNFILKIVFIDKKLLSLSWVIESYFLITPDKVVYLINTLLNIFDTKEIKDYVHQEILKVWNNLINSNDEKFFNFFKLFYMQNPLKSLDLIHKKYLKQNFNNDILEIICGFIDYKDYLSTAFDLYFLYYLNNQDCYDKFLNVAKHYFEFNRNCEIDCFTIIVKFLEKAKKYSDNFQNLSVNRLVIEVSTTYLGIKYFLGYYKITKNEYRKLIWEYLYTISNNPAYKESIINIIFTYLTEEFYNEYIEVLTFDLYYIEKIIKDYFNPNNSIDILVVYKLLKVISKKNISNVYSFDEYIKADMFQIYSVIYNDCQDLTKTNSYLEEYIRESKLDKITKLIDIYKEIKQYRPNFDFTTIFNVIYNTSPNIYWDVIKYYIKKDTPGILHVEYIVQKLISLINHHEIIDFINQSKFNQKSYWIYSYYHELPRENITQQEVDDLYKFLYIQQNQNFKEFFSGDIWFLKKYSDVDADMFLNGCNIIFNNKDHAPSIVKCYLSFLFLNQYHIEDIVSSFKDNLELLEDIFCFFLKEQEIYPNSTYISFLKIIYTLDSTFLNKYIDFLIKNEFFCKKGILELNNVFFSFDNYIDIYNIIFEQLLNINYYKALKFVECLSFYEHELLLDNWISQRIKFYCKNKKEISCLFRAISLLNYDKKLKYILMILEKNIFIEDFKLIDLCPYSFIGYGLDEYNESIRLIDALSKKMDRIENIDFRLYLDEIKNNIQKKIHKFRIEMALDNLNLSK